MVRTVHFSTHLLMVVEDTVSPERSSADNVPVGENVSLFRVHHEACCLAAGCAVGVEAESLTEVY
jgi:hypothetical protein